MLVYDFYSRLDYAIFFIIKKKRGVSPDLSGKTPLFYPFAYVDI